MVQGRQNGRKNVYEVCTIARYAKGQCNGMVRLTWQLNDPLRLPMVVPYVPRIKGLVVKDATTEILPIRRINFQ
jgi:hypothetical protein